MQLGLRDADDDLVVIVVEAYGSYVSLACEEYDDEVAVFVADDPRIADLLEEYPGAQVFPWQPAHDEFDELLKRTA